MNLWAIQIQRKSHSKEVLSAKLVDVDTMQVSYVPEYQLYQAIITGTLSVNNICIVKNHLELTGYESKLKQYNSKMYMNRDRNGDILIESFVIVLAGHRGVYDFLVDDIHNSDKAMRIYGTVNDLDEYLDNKNIEWENYGVYNGIVTNTKYAGREGMYKIIGHTLDGKETDFYSEYFDKIANIRLKLKCVNCIMFHKNGLLVLTDMYFNEDDITIPEGIQYFGISTGGALSIVLPKSLCKISQKAFENDDDILQITFQQSLKKLPPLIFKDSNLQIVEQTDGVKFESVGKGAFANCYYLRNPIIMNVDIIEELAFADSYIKGFKSDNCKIIKSKAFRDCQHLKVVELPNAIEIEDKAFSGCKKLKEVIVSSKANIASTAFPKNTHIRYV